MSYRVLIPTAGIGSRLGSYTKYLNKSLVSVDNKPVLSHQINNFPIDCEFVVALGYKGDLVREYLEITYSKNRFIYVDVNPYIGEGSGLGYTIMCCQKYLKERFIFISCDTLVANSIPSPISNWVGLSKEGDRNLYRSAELRNEVVIDIKEKSTEDSDLFPYIGLAGVNSYNLFWDAMNEGGEQAISIGEVYGLKRLISKNKVEGKVFNWFDTGQIESLKKTRQEYSKASNYNILEKEDESIWFENGKVIKFSADTNFISNRVKRSKELIGFVPEIISSSTNMYSYKKIEAKVLSECVTIDIFSQLLDKCKEFWKIENLNSGEQEKFETKCKSFYKKKTIDRISLFYQRFDKSDSIQIINGKKVKLLSELLDNICWDDLSKGIPGRFHGDFHFENILYSHHTNNFTFIDWRQDFAGDIHTGDINYDLAKMLHGLIVNHEIISDGKYEVIWHENSITYKLERKQILIDCEEYLYQWCETNSYDVRKIKIITSLIYLNIAALHHYPYSLLLYSLGKNLLNDLI